MICQFPRQTRYGSPANRPKAKVTAAQSAILPLYTRHGLNGAQPIPILKPYTPRRVAAAELARTSTLTILYQYAAMGYAACMFLGIWRLSTLDVTCEKAIANGLESIERSLTYLSGEIDT